MSTTSTESIAVRASFATPACLAPSEYARRLDAAYADYLARCSAGEVIDEDSLCRKHTPVRSSLARLMSVHRLLADNPDLLAEDVGAEPAWPETGDVFEGFELRALLGKGAFARVYLASERALGDRLVAVKITPYGAYEAATLGRIEHPNIVPIHSVMQHSGRGLAIVCMPYRGRATLHDVFDSVPVHGPLPGAATIIDACGDAALPAAPVPRLLRAGRYADAVRLIGAQLADALAYLHDRGTSHRDFKPSNVLMQPDGTPLLLDFNLSDTPGTPNARLGGTPAYMAPEQLQALSPGSACTTDGKVDVFALGVVLYQWLGQKAPFGHAPHGLSETARLELIRRQQAGPAPLVREGLDASLTRLIEKCLAFDPAQRPTAREVATALRQQLRPQRRLARAVARRPRAVAAAIAMALALMAALAAFAATRPTADERAFQQGVAAYREHRFEEANEQFNRAVVARPEEVAYRYARGCTLAKLGERKKEYFNLAVAEFEAAEKLRSDPRHAAGMAYCFQRLAQMGPARSLYEEALEGGLRSASILNNLACCCLLLSDKARAEACLKQALELDPDMVQAHWNLASVQKSLWAPSLVKSREERVRNPAYARQLKVAKQHLLRAIELTPVPPAELFLDAAHAHALAAELDPQDCELAMQLSEHAVRAGMQRSKLLNDKYLSIVLETHPRFAEFTRGQPGAPTPKISRLVDPLSGL